MGFVRKLTGSGVASATLQGAELQAEAAEAAAQRFEPFRELGLGGIEQAGFLTDPQQQFDFLQNNPLFDLALQNANTQTNQSAAASGRLSAGDTLQQLSNNVLLAASPLIQSQKTSIADLLNIGSGTAAAQGGLETDAAAAIAAGKVGAASAGQQGAANIAGLGTTLGGAAIFASDNRLKENVNKIGSEKGHNIYSWTWNKIANSLGLFGDSFGVIAQEVLKIHPDAVVTNGEYMKVNYQMLGINHGG